MIECITRDIEDQRKPPAGNTRATAVEGLAPGSIYPKGDEDWYYRNGQATSIQLYSTPKASLNGAWGAARMDVYVNGALKAQGVMEYQTGTPLAALYEVRVFSPEIVAYRALFCPDDGC